MQGVEDLQQRISGGEFEVGSMLPSYAELAETYGVSVTVARAAVAQLKAIGLVATHQGKGTFVISTGEAPRTSLSGEVQALKRDLVALTKRVETLEAQGNRSSDG